MSDRFITRRQWLFFALFLSALCQESHAQICSTGACDQPRILTRSKTVALKKNLVVQQFAVPIGVPVASEAQVYYEPQIEYEMRPSQQDRSYALETPRDERSEIERLAAAMVLANDPEFKKKILAQYGPLSADRVIQQRCASCHHGAEAKGGLDLSGGVASFDAGLKQRIVGRILAEDESKRMPKDGELSRKEFRALMSAFVK